VLLDFGFAFDPSNPGQMVVGDPFKEDISSIWGLLGYLFGQQEALTWMENVGPTKSQDPVWMQVMLETRGIGERTSWCPIQDWEWGNVTTSPSEMEVLSEDLELTAMFGDK
jgi:hypothetical protein